MCGGTNGVVGVGILPNCRPPLPGPTPEKVPPLGGVYPGGPGGGMSGTPGMVRRSGLESGPSSVTARSSESSEEPGGAGGAFRWLTVSPLSLRVRSVDADGFVQRSRTRS
jgi:hypothetical protein